MMIVPAGVKVHLALGYTDMRKGMDGLAMLVQETLKKDPFCGHLFAFRGKRAQIIKILFWDGNGLCLFTKRLDRGGFVWPRLVRRLHHAVSGAARDADRGHRLARARTHMEARSCRLRYCRNPHRI
ncbi:IS66 family insertion sequence element accessory protein TnpB [Bradyrhizobium valentinum]|uniref:IS66 family insertion sequence element accessory protein TnpB n=1 Tax=Bradyrhizobium valentinum TaxID=1518501 RepID=UPI000A59C27F